MYTLTFFNKHHQTRTVVAVSEDLEEVKKTVGTLNSSIGYDYNGGRSVWDQDATGYFGWQEVPTLDKTTVLQILEKKRRLDKGDALP